MEESRGKEEAEQEGTEQGSHLAVHPGAAFKPYEWKYHIASKDLEIHVASRVHVAFLRG